MAHAFAGRIPPSPAREPARTPVADESFDPARACSWLDSGAIDSAMRYVIGGLGDGGAAARAGGRSPQDWQELLRRLAQEPFIARSRERAAGYGGDPAALDSVLELAADGPAVSPLGRVLHAWLSQHSLTFDALRRRHAYLTREIDSAALRDPGAPIVGFFAGRARELQASAEFRAGRVQACVIDYDADALAGCAGGAAVDRLTTCRATLAQVLSGELRMFHCSLVYVPDLAMHLAPPTLGAVLETLVDWLRPGGEIVVAAFAELPERGFLDFAADWQPNTLRIDALLRLVRDVDGVVTSLRRDPTSGLAFLHLARR